MTLIDNNRVFCQTCTNTIRPVTSLVLTITDAHDLKVFAAGPYQEPLRSLILKKRGHDIVASTHLAYLILENTPVAQRQYDYIVPIPLHWTRYAFRGYNQATEIARVIGKVRNIPVKEFLYRTRRSPFQSQISFKERAQNVAGIFKIDSRIVNPKLQESLYGKHLLIVDDLCTTGSTLRAAAHALLRLRPASITAVVACRVP